MIIINVKTNEKRCEARAEYWTNDKGLHLSRCWAGKRKTPCYFYRMASIEDAKKHSEEFIKRYQDIADRSAKQRQLERDFKHDIKIGDVLYTSGGWEQTNVDFYQVINLKGKKSLVVRKIDFMSTYNNERMSGHKKPVIDSFIGKEITGIYGFYGMKINSYSRASKYDGEPKYYSTYG